MVHKLSTTQRQFGEDFSQFLNLRLHMQENVAEVVRAVIDRVCEQGDEALYELTRQFDRFDLNAENLRIGPQEMAHAVSLCSPELIRSLKKSVERIRRYSEKQMPHDMQYTDEEGVLLGWRWTPVDSVGLYVPGGKASYPSSVLMNAVPAQVAGVKRMAMVVPTPDGEISPAVLAAAHIVGVHEIYRVGGAQAIAALAFGTQSITPVDKIVGPGNAYVAEAKRQVFGQVGIDMVAGPSEVLVVADDSADPSWIAADLLSQAEHDELAQAILVTDSSSLAHAVEKAVEEQLSNLPRADIARSSWQNYGAIMLVRDLDEAAGIINDIAPEHLELLVEYPEDWLGVVRHAGAIFLGHHTPEAVGDYIAGPSHVLPTSRSARYSSGLSVFDFIKRTSLIGFGQDSLQRLGMYAEVMATQEGLQAHAQSVKKRVKQPVPA